MKHIFFGFICVMVPLFISAQTLPEPEQVLYLPWGNQIEYREAPGGRFGPRSFLVEENQVYLLNTNRNQIDRMAQDSLRSFVAVPPFSDDFAVSGNQVYVLHENKISRVTSQGTNLVYTPENPRDVVGGVQIVAQKLVAHLANGQSKILNNQSSLKTISGKYFSAQKIVSVQKVGNHTIDLVRSGSTDRIQFTSEYPLGSVRVIGTDSIGRTYLVVDYITQQVPLQVESAIQIYGADNNLIFKLDLPNVHYTYLFKQFQVTSDGLLYHLISTKEGLSLYRWDFSEIGNTSHPVELQYDQSFDLDNQNYNELEIQEYTPDLPKDSPRIQPTSVTRSQALSTGDTYVEHTWTCQSFNMSNGVVTAPDGDYVKTPTWLSEGEMQKVPYQWGGFRTLSQFDSGIASGGYAGDIHTDGVSGYAYGVDCSGFVSRCWNLPYQYSTSMMPQITGQYTSWEQLQAADAIHKVGHVRMMVSWNQNGTLNVVESSGADWRVSYRTYATSQLGAYTPRYYVNMEGSPTPLPTPILQSVTVTNDSLNLNWECDQSDGVAGYHLYESTDGLNWDLTYPVVDLPLSLAAAGISYDPAAPIFYRLRTVDEADTSRESIMSDLYGAFRPDGAQNPVLIVDGFDRFGGSGSWGSPYHPFATKIGQALAELNVPFETCANEAVTRDEIVLDDYNAVIWLLGDESTVDETFSTMEQSYVSDYLGNGGQLFVSGSELGWDLDNQGSAADKSFYNQYLRADYEVDDSNSYTVYGISGSIFEGLEFQYDNGSHNVYEEDWPDGISVMNGGQAALEYQGTSYAAAIQYSGTFGDGTIPGKLVYLAFPVETIYDHSQLNDFLAQVVTYFGYQSSTGVAETPGNVISEFSVEQNYPNPFNPSTTLRYSIPLSGEVTLKVYNMKGQIVFTRRFGHVAAGQFSQEIDLHNLASGTYFGQVTWVSDGGVFRSKTQKMLLLK